MCIPGKYIDKLNSVNLIFWNDSIAKAVSCVQLLSEGTVHKLLLGGLMQMKKFWESSRSKNEKKNSGLPPFIGKKIMGQTQPGKKLWNSPFTRKFVIYLNAPPIMRVKKFKDPPFSIRSAPQVYVNGPSSYSSGIRY